MALRSAGGSQLNPRRGAHFDNETHTHTQVMIFKGGKKMDTIIGAVPKPTLVQAVEKYL
jgi:hypothetical protein